MPLRTETRDLVVSVLVVSGLVIGGILYAFLVPERFWPHLTHGWFVFVCMTALLEFILIKMYWPFRRSGKVWLVLGILLLIHIGAYVEVLRHIEDVPVLSYFLTIPAEVMIAATITKIWLNVLPTKVKL
jgi:hypothetical protein